MEAEDTATELDANEPKAKENGVKEMVSDEEEDDLAVDPFQHQLLLTTLQWIQTILLGMILVPVRLILIVFFMVILWIISSVSLRVVAKGKHNMISIFSVFNDVKFYILLNSLGY